MRMLLALLLIVVLLASSCTQPPAKTPTPISTRETPEPATPGPTSEPSLTATPPAPTPTPVAGPELLKVIGQIGGPTQAVAVEGDNAYVGVGLRLIVLDTANLANPVEVGATEPFEGYVNDVVIVGSTAFVAAGGAGLYTLDISDAARPVVVGSHDTPGYAESVAVSGKYAYVADGPAGLRVFDVENLSHPTEVGQAYGLNYVFYVAVDGQYAYVAAAGAGLLVANVSDPTKPKEAGALDTPGYAYGVTVAGSTAYVADGWGGLRIIDISQPSTPVEVGTVETPGWVFDVDYAEDKAYLADGSGGGWVLDVSDPAKPAILGNLSGSQNPSGQHITKLTLSQQFVYAVDRGTGVQVIDVSRPEQPTHVALYKPAGFAGHVAVDGNHAYVGGTYPGTADLRVLDVSDPAHMREILVLERGVNGRIVEVQGNYLYMFGWRDREMFQIFDLANPAQPKTVSFQPLDGPPVSMFLKNGNSYITTEFGLEIVDISNPASPSKLGVLDFAQGRGRAAGADTTMGVAVSGDFAYITHSSHGLMVIDVANPAEPTVVTSSRPEVWAWSLVVAGDFAYLASNDSLEVVDISNPMDPKWVADHPLPAPGQHLTFADGVVYVASGPGGVQAFDVTNPRNPVLIGSHPLTGRASAVDVDANYIYVASGDGGLYVLERPSTNNAALKTNVEASSHRAVSWPEGGAESPVPLLVSIPSSVKPANQSVAVSDRSSSAVQPDALHPDDVVPTPVVMPGTGRTLIVTSGADSGPGSLRWALENAGSGDIITLDPVIFPPGSPNTIQPVSALPHLSQGSLTIDASNAGVILDGNRTPAGTNGLTITSDHNIVRGLQITGFPGAGVGIAGGSYNTIGGDRGRGSGPSGEGNVISGNTVGVGISGCLGGVTSDVGVGFCDGHSRGNRIIGNYIGPDSTGMRSGGSQGTGVWVFGDSAHNTIGGPTAADRNIISGNVRAGVSLMRGSHENSVAGNYIGTDASGEKALGNGMGVSIEAGYNSVVSGNVISGNTASGVVINDPSGIGNEIIGNFIGTDASGTAALGNDEGISVMQSFNKVGGTTPEERNIVSGNKGKGIRIGWQGTTGVVVIGNYVGTDVTGTKVLGNGSHGIWLTEGAYHNFIGGTTTAEGNIIGGSLRGWTYGIALERAGIRWNFVAGNNVGISTDGVTALPNQSGIGIQGADYNFVQANIVTHNIDIGVFIQHGEGNRVHHNRIINNGANASDGGNNSWDDGREGNYWSDYNGIDADSNGIGDTPHPVAPNGADGYPLMKPEEALR